MAFYIDTSKVRNRSSVCLDATGTLRPQTAELGFALLACGLQRIEERNVLDVYCRIAFYETVFGTGDNGGFDVDTIGLHVGLEINTAYEKSSAFAARIFAAHNREVVARLHAELRRVAEKP